VRDTGLEEEEGRVVENIKVNQLEIQYVYTLERTLLLTRQGWEVCCCCCGVVGCMFYLSTSKFVIVIYDEDDDDDDGGVDWDVCCC